LTTKNKLDKTFGPSGSSAGIFIFVVGLIATYFAFTGLILIVLGGFVGFSSTSTWIDFDKKRVKFCNTIFGIMSLGQWIDIQKDMKIGIKKSNTVWRTYSRSNQSIDIQNNDYRLILYNSDNKVITALMKTDNLNTAQYNLEKLCLEFGIESI